MLSLGIEPSGPVKTADLQSAPAPYGSISAIYLIEEGGRLAIAGLPMESNHRRHAHTLCLRAVADLPLRGLAWPAADRQSATPSELHTVPGLNTGSPCFASTVPRIGWPLCWARKNHMPSARGLADRRFLQRRQCVALRMLRSQFQRLLPESNRNSVTCCRRGLEPLTEPVSTTSTAATTAGTQNTNL